MRSDYWMATLTLVNVREKCFLLAFSDIDFLWDYLHSTSILSILGHVGVRFGHISIQVKSV
jgi:hypothetical protein